MRRMLIPTLVGLLVVAIAAGVAIATRTPTNDNDFKYTIGLWGDLPYSAVQEKPGVPNLIADMNSQDIEFSVHDGDLKAGNGTPGSPDGDDLHRRDLRPGAQLAQLAEEAGDVHAGRQRLDRLRSPGQRRLQLARTPRPRAPLFFSTPFSMGQAQLQQLVQSTPLCLGVKRPDGVRREPPLDLQGHHVRDPQRAGLVQQPVRHGARTRPSTRRATPPTSPGSHEHVRRGEVQQAPRGDADHHRPIPASTSPTPPARRCAIRTRSPRPTASPTASRRSSSRCATKSIAFRKPVVLRPRRLALLPRRQAAPRLAGSAPRELHARSRRSATTRPTATTTCTG